MGAGTNANVLFEKKIKFVLYKMECIMIKGHGNYVQNIIDIGRNKVY